MTRLIDADELRNYFLSIPDDVYTTSYILAVIDEMPTYDVHAHVHIDMETAFTKAVEEIKKEIEGDPEWLKQILQ